MELGNKNITGLVCSVQLLYLKIRCYANVLMEVQDYMRQAPSSHITALLEQVGDCSKIIWSFFAPFRLPPPLADLVSRNFNSMAFMLQNIGSPTYPTHHYQFFWFCTFKLLTLKCPSIKTCLHPYQQGVGLPLVSSYLWVPFGRVPSNPA